jgi:hypothetical protein
MRRGLAYLTSRLHFDRVLTFSRQVLDQNLNQNGDERIDDKHVKRTIGDYNRNGSVGNERFNQLNTNAYQIDTECYTRYQHKDANVDGMVCY